MLCSLHGCFPYPDECVLWGSWYGLHITCQQWGSFISAGRRKMQSIHQKRAKKRKQADKTHKHCLGVRERGQEACVISAQWSVQFFWIKISNPYGILQIYGVMRKHNCRTRVLTVHYCLWNLSRKVQYPSMSCPLVR